MIRFVNKVALYVFTFARTFSRNWVGFAKHALDAAYGLQ
jgi:hypothetical protein